MNSRTRRLRCAGRLDQQRAVDVAEQSLQEVMTSSSPMAPPEVEIAQRHPGRNRKFLPVEVEFEHWCFPQGAQLRQRCGFDSVRFRR